MKKIRGRVSKRWPYALIAFVLLGSYSYYALQRSLPLINPSVPISLSQTTPADSHLSWPSTGQSAAGILDSDILNTHGAQRPIPIASTAKVITALVVLQTKPLKPDQQGPITTLTATDVAFYNNYAAQDGSLVPVSAGEQISEYQMLQSIMLPSANNIADSMALWAFGSLKAYGTAANTYLTQHGLTNTRVGEDASGLSPTTTSTAQDLVKLGKLAMNEPVLSKIVGQSSATGIPHTSTVKNVNFLLGTANIVGIKTGNTEQAGGVFISASRVTINSKPVTIVTSVVGTPTLFIALKDSLALIKSAQANFRTVSLIKTGDIVGRYDVPWSSSIDAIASQDLTINTWKGSVAKAKVRLKPVGINDKIAGEVIVPASALSNKRAVSIKLRNSPSVPSSWWRLTHPWH